MISVRLVDQLGPLVGAVGLSSGVAIMQPVMAPSARGAACMMS